MAGNDSGLDTTEWRASRPNVTAAPSTADLGEGWREQRPNVAVVTPPASTGAPGWRPTRVNS